MEITCCQTRIHDVTPLLFRDPFGATKNWLFVPATWCGRRDFCGLYLPKCSPNHHNFQHKIHNIYIYTVYIFICAIYPPDQKYYILYTYTQTQSAPSCLLTLGILNELARHSALRTCETPDEPLRESMDKAELQDVVCWIFLICWPGLKRLKPW